MINQVLKQNYYELFNLKPAFRLDLSYLQQQLRELQKKFHPDNFSDAAMLPLAKQSLLVSGQINQAYVTLSQGLSRAIYLLAIYGIKVDLVHDTKFPVEFLMQQIELREQITAAEVNQDFAALEKIEASLIKSSRDLEQQIADLFDSEKYSEIIELIKELAFYSKLEQLVSNCLQQF